MGEPGGTTERRRCYRCGELEQETLPLRLLPGSRHLVLCPACYAFIWGERPVRLKPPKSGERRH